MLTNRGKAVLLFSLLLVVLGRLLGVTELFGLAAAGVGVVLLNRLLLAVSRLQVAVSARVTPEAVGVGEPAELELEVENLGPAASPANRLLLVPREDEGPVIEVGRLLPGESVAVSLRLYTGRRGRHEMGGFDAVLVDSLGTTEHRLTSRGPVRYGVRPRRDVLPSALPATVGDGSGGLASTRGFSHLRPYVPGDDLRRVHWPTSARLGGLFVREGGEPELDRSGGLTVVLLNRCAAPATDADFEEAVTVTASILSAAAEEGSFRLIEKGAGDTGYGFGSRHLDECLESLIDVRPAKVDPLHPDPPLGTERDRALVVVTAGRDDALLEAQLGVPVGQLATRHRPVVLVITGTPHSGIENDEGMVVVSLTSGERSVLLWSARAEVVMGT